MDYTEKSPAILSLCPGVLGIERGLGRAFERLGWRRGEAVAYVEIEAVVIENLVCAMEQGILAPAPVWSNVKTFNAQPFRNCIDWITGGYPCQPFSLSGKQAGEEDPRHLWPYIREAIKTIKPAGCFFENVANHLNVGYETVRSELQEMGYRVKEGIYSAEEVGAPHRRERLFILGIMGSTEGGDELGAQNVAHSNNSGGGENWQPTELWTNGTEQSPGNSRPSNAGKERKRQKRSLWPARPGEEQYEWEAPRVIESGVGCTVDGYNFREDLLRMYGNGVVEQTAELAFLDLLRKHFCK